MSDASLARVVGVLTSPEKTFKAIRERPTWLVALLLLLILGAGTYSLLSQRMDMGQIVRESIEKSGRDMPEETIEKLTDFYDRFGTTFGMAFIAVGQPVLFLLGSLGIWVAVKLVGAELSFKQNWSTFVHSQMPHAAAAVLSLPAILSKDEFHFADVQTGSLLPSNLGYFAPEEASPAMLSLLSSIDVFSLWALVLLILGVAAVGRVRRGPATAAVVACWVLYVLGKAGWAALFG
jgi:Yip1 domain